MIHRSAIAVVCVRIAKWEQGSRAERGREALSWLGSGTTGPGGALDGDFGKIYAPLLDTRRCLSVVMRVLD
ncbi:hypothetical protein K438DRAFT_1846802 [Mycena galopus ATCC 62051]|nr:hypothetical protein K438DRAFT_1846802 [Mycena galopus ATCC 62051]